MVKKHKKGIINNSGTMNNEDDAQGGGGMISPKNHLKNISAKEAQPKKSDLLAAHKEADNLLKREVLDERIRAKENMKGDDFSSIIIMPKYITDPRLKVDRESYPEPPKELYIGLGWDEDKETKRKHYR